jgi:Mg2+ and Co2+ transporter CorA
MNVGGIPLSGSPHGFYVVLSFLLAWTGLLAWLLRRRFRE